LSRSLAAFIEESVTGGTQSTDTRKELIFYAFLLWLVFGCK